MGRTVAIGIQSFEKIRRKNCFYVDKTSFIKEWWESEDEVTLITRPRRFGKTLNMSMLECFFSVDYKDRGDLFEGLSIWQEETYRQLQGTYPVIFLSFASIKSSNFKTAKMEIYQVIVELFSRNSFLLKEGILDGEDEEFFKSVCMQMPEYVANKAIQRMSYFLSNYYGKKVIILLDEYDTPMQEAYVNGFWDEMVSLTRSLFNATFKTNPYLERGLMTGITRVSKESIFSDLNNPEVVTITSDKYATSFGFTEEEVFDSLKECGLSEHKDVVKKWYDGFIFGSVSDIYNPWSILNYLSNGDLGTYWANTSSNAIVSALLREGDRRIKTTFEQLLKGESISCPIDEQVVYNQLGKRESAIWSLLLASGYLKVLRKESHEEVVSGYPKYELMLTNLEVKHMFEGLIHDWFGETEGNYNEFVDALLLGDLEAMNVYMNRVSVQTFSYFDTVKSSLSEEPERFYHGFVLGLIVDLAKDYVVTSNRESGFGRYDVMIEPKDVNGKAFILEFKVFNPNREAALEETVQNALKQIKEKNYAANLIAKGIKEENIRKYGFAFKGKKVLIG